jgi:hypothetical protein
MKLILTILIYILPGIVSAKEWNFDVYLDKTKIGEHTFKLNEANELTSQASFNVKVLFINAYQYSHKAVETWQGGCLKSLESITLENNVTTKVKGQVSDGKFLVNDGKVSQELPECPMTFAYWNQKMLTQTKLLNPQNAQWLDTRIMKIGNEKLVVNGGEIETTHYKLDASLEGKQKLNIDLWYDSSNHEWVSLRSITPEGYIINYRLK